MTVDDSVAFAAAVCDDVATDTPSCRNQGLSVVSAGLDNTALGERGVMGGDEGGVA